MSFSLHSYMYCWHQSKCEKEKRFSASFWARSIRHEVLMIKYPKEYEWKKVSRRRSISCITLWDDGARWWNAWWNEKKRKIKEEKLWHCGGIERHCDDDDQWLWQWSGVEDEHRREHQNTRWESKHIHSIAQQWEWQKEMFYRFLFSLSL